DRTAERADRIAERANRIAERANRTDRSGERTDRSGERGQRSGQRAGRRAPAHCPGLSEASALLLPRNAEDEDPFGRQEALQGDRDREGPGTALVHEPHPREEVIEA